MRFTNGPDLYVPTRVERRGSAIAHGSGLLFGVPLILLAGFFLGVPPAIAYFPCPFIAYYVFARPFRSKKLPWGAFQGMQAAVIHHGRRISGGFGRSGSDSSSRSIPK